MGYHGSQLYHLAFEKGYVPDVASFQAWVESLQLEITRCDYPSVPEVIAAIHGAGGIAVLAHPYAKSEFHDFAEDDVASLAGEGLDGIEVFHPLHLEDGMVARYADLCDKHRLLKTGGSDSHGKAVYPNRRYVGGVTCDWVLVQQRLELYG